MFEVKFNKYGNNYLINKKSYKRHGHAIEIIILIYINFKY